MGHPHMLCGSPRSRRHSRGGKVGEEGELEEGRSQPLVGLNGQGVHGKEEVAKGKAAALGNLDAARHGPNGRGVPAGVRIKDESAFRQAG